ncbi:metallo-beta-lactamase domain [Colletotrichum incanum]|uniref:Metallo-beta-lactamase domain n=1 Tax=Colletotrichum incanum TaxID=1573173 RepID=A0A166LAM8_COLIC|nr:metallo-beta-lactamase domain [Colletotrichum incanum]OHX00149.1 metallo-beta-lactamase domain protein [Colletotrichum incanum]
MTTHSPLRFAVYVAPPIPCVDFINNVKEGHTWSPISCTLVYSDTEAVLIDTPITIEQTKDLIRWIEKVAPNRKLSYIYITHGHADHFLGISQLVQRYPSAVPLATQATIKHIEQQSEEEYFNSTWEAFFPGGQIYKPITQPLPLPDSNEFKLQDRWLSKAIEVGHSDTHDSSVMWVPEIKLAVCGDAVYGEVHQMLLEANTKSKREEWIRAVEQVEALDPMYVVPGHKKAEEPDGVWHLANTKRYLLDWGNLLRSSLKEPRELYEAMIKLYPNRFNRMPVLWSAGAAFQVPEKARF